MYVPMCQDVCKVVYTVCMYLLAPSRFFFPRKLHKILEDTEYSGWKTKQHLEMARLSNSQHWERWGKYDVHQRGS